MHDDDVDSVSQVQARWNRTADDLHTALRKLIPKVPEMSGTEVKAFGEALTGCFWLGFQSHTLDKRVELYERKLSDD